MKYFEFIGFIGMSDIFSRSREKIREKSGVIKIIKGSLWFVVILLETVRPVERSE